MNTEHRITNYDDSVRFASVNRLKVYARRHNTRDSIMLASFSFIFRWCWCCCWAVRHSRFRLIFSRGTSHTKYARGINKTTEFITYIHFYMWKTFFPSHRSRRRRHHHMCLFSWVLFCVHIFSLLSLSLLLCLCVWLNKRNKNFDNWC